MGKINYTILASELTRDPIELGYHYLSRPQIVDLMNKPQFSEASIDANTDEIRNQLGVAPSSSKSSASLFIVNMADFAKRSRMELLFGPGTVVTLDDLQLAIP